MAVASQDARRSGRRKRSVASEVLRVGVTEAQAAGSLARGFLALALSRSLPRLSRLAQFRSLGFRQRISNQLSHSGGASERRAIAASGSAGRSATFRDAVECGLPVGGERDEKWEGLAHWMAGFRYSRSVGTSIK